MKSLTAVLILSGLSVIANESHARYSPTAELTAEREYVVPGKSVILDGSDSYDPDQGSYITKYEWDKPK